MSVLYEDAKIRITHRTLEVWGSTYHRYAISDLSSVRTVEQTSRPRVGKAVVRCANGVIGVVVAVVVQGQVAKQLGPLLVVVIATMVTVGCIGTILVAHWRRHRTYSIWALHAGQQVQLFRCTNSIEFGQAARALQRALEHHRELN
jgi:hypothetical protein